MPRVDVTGQIKTLEQEGQAIEAELLELFSDPELRHGVRAPGGWVLRSRPRTRRDYAPDNRDAIKDLQQRAGRAQPLVSTYLCLTHRSTRAPNRGSKPIGRSLEHPFQGFCARNGKNHV